MSITPVPISIRLVLAPTAASSGNGEASWRAKWCTRKYAPSAPSSSAATASSMDWSSASDADAVCDCGDGVQWPNDRNPIFFMAGPPAQIRSSSQDGPAVLAPTASTRDLQAAVGRHHGDVPPAAGPPVCRLDYPLVPGAWCVNAADATVLPGRYAGPRRRLSRTRTTSCRTEVRPPSAVSPAGGRLPHGRATSRSGDCPQRSRRRRSATAFVAPARIGSRRPRRRPILARLSAARRRLPRWPPGARPPGRRRR